MSKTGLGSGGKAVALPGDVHGIALRADVNHDPRAPLRHQRGTRGFSLGERNDLFSHVMTHYLGLVAWF